MDDQDVTGACEAAPKRPQTNAHVGLGRDLLRHLDDAADLVIPLLLERGEHAFTGGV
jgi:hypothetical protein